MEQYICGGTLASDIASENSTVTLNLTTYKQNINIIKLSDATTEVQMAEKANNEINKTNFYNLAIKAYNLQEILSNDASKYTTATKEISYLEVNADLKASNYEKMCVEIINGYQFVLEEYNNVLAEMVSMLSA